MPNQENDIYNEWASGISLANPDSKNDFFEEIPTELNNPADFSVTPEQLPANPTEPFVPPAPPEPEISGPEIRPSKSGGSIALEKTSRGWKLALDSGDSNKPIENFYAANKDELIFSLADGKLEATKAIYRLKKEKLLGGEEVSSTGNIPVMAKPMPNVSQLTADDVVEIKNKMSGDNPSEGFDSYIQKRFGLNPDQLAASLRSAEEAKMIVEGQRVQAEVKEINEDFIKSNPDFANEYSNDPENVRKLIARMAKAHLNKRISSKTSQIDVDNTIYELYAKGVWTVDNLETAKDELIDIGELRKPLVSAPVSNQEPQQVVAPSNPSVPAPPRIATPTGQPVGFGLSEKGNTPSAVPDEKPLSDVDLQNMSLSQVREVAAAQLRAMRQGRQ